MVRSGLLLRLSGRVCLRTVLPCFFFNAVFKFFESSLWVVEVEIPKPPACHEVCFEKPFRPTIGISLARWAVLTNFLPKTI